MNRFAEIFYKNKIICCYIKELKDKKAKVLLPNNKEEIINTNQIIYIDQASTNTPNVTQELQIKNNLRENLKNDFSLSIENIWESTSDLEIDIIEASLLLELFLNRKPSDDEIASFLRKIIETQNYFQFITTNTIKYLKPYEVEKIKEKREKILLKTQKIQNLKKIIEQLIKKAEQIATKESKMNPENYKYWIENLKNYVLFDKSPEKNIIEEVLKEKNIHNIPQLFEILVKNNIVEEDYFYELSRLGFPEEFSQEEYQETYEIANLQLDYKDVFKDLFEDLTYLDSFTVDAEYTKDFDDAISFEKYNDKIFLYVHISNVASFVKPDSLLFKNSLKKMQTLYLPDKIIPMLPTILSEEKFSLKQNQIKDCVTFKFEMDSFYNLTDFKIFLSKIHVKSRLTYEEVNQKILEGDSFWNELYFLLSNFKNMRLQNGAVQVILPEVLVKVSEDGKITVKKMEFTKAHELVSEAMILANYYCAKFLSQNQISAIYRTQSEPYKIIPINNIIDSLN
ncbi:MAG: ribonuclease catalytic domain-containing protein, partial [bacterium]